MLRITYQKGREEYKHKQNSTIVAEKLKVALDIIKQCSKGLKISNIYLFIYVSYTGAIGSSACDEAQPNWLLIYCQLNRKRKWQHINPFSFA